jgi:hypothetical protein
VNPEKPGPDQHEKASKHDERHISSMQSGDESCE